MPYLLLALLALSVNVHAAIAIGDSAPNIPLTDTKGAVHRLSDYAGKYVVLEWTNNECPFVQKHYKNGDMQALQRKYTAQGVIWLSVVSSAPGKQGYASPEQADAITAEQNAAPTAKILDVTGELGHLLEAKTSPHMYVFAPEGKLIYQGAIDSIRSVNSDDIPKAVNYVSKALDESMAGHAVSIPQTTAYGCGIKY